MLEKRFRELYTWTAFYDDSTVMNLECRCGFHHVYQDIDRTKLAAFGIYKIVDDPLAEYEVSELIYRVFLEPNQKLVYRRRPNLDIYTGHILSELILVGTTQKVNGTDVQNIAYIDVETCLIQVAGKWIGSTPTLRREEKLND